MRLLIDITPEGSGYRAEVKTERPELTIWTSTFSAYPQSGPARTASVSLSLTEQILAVIDRETP